MDKRVEEFIKKCDALRAFIDDNENFIIRNRKVIQMMEENNIPIPDELLTSTEKLEIAQIDLIKDFDEVQKGLKTIRDNCDHDFVPSGDNTVKCSKCGLIQWTK